MHVCIGDVHRKKKIALHQNYTLWPALQQDNLLPKTTQNKPAEAL
jgi:hypothetical protein